MQSVWVDEFFSKLHVAYLKPRGFTKTRRTFSRDRGSYFERFNFQGSSWNSSSQEAWRFYLNAGVEFDDIPPDVDNRGFPKTHVYGRVNDFLNGCKSEFDLRESNHAELYPILVDLLENVSHSIAERLATLRAAARKGQTLWYDPA